MVVLPTKNDTPFPNQPQRMAMKAAWTKVQLHNGRSLEARASSILARRRGSVRANEVRNAMNRVRWLYLTAIAVAGLALAPVALRAAPAEDFYKGRQIVMILSTEAGGGYAASANALIPFLSANIPGRPRIIVQYMPGAGGIRALNHLNSVAPKDGTRIALIQSTAPFAPLFGVEAARYDPRRLNWLGALERNTGMCVAWAPSGIATWQDVLDKEFVVGASGAGSQMETFPAMVNRLFGTKIRVVSGYKGGVEVFLAMERGEVQGRCGSMASAMANARPDWLPQKKVTVPFQITLERDREFPDVPALGEFAKDTRTRQVLELVAAPLAMDKPLVMAEGVPPERVTLIRRAFQAAVSDPAFLAEAKRLRIESDAVPAERVTQILTAAYAMSADVIGEAREAMNLTGAN
jgi:tripartite-type tricarboxylate transporter receptor subunit TctC